MNKYFACILLVLYTYISSAQNIGIGTNSPGFPLNFANTLGDKIALWGNTGNHYGLGIQSGLLQIHTDLSNSNITFGYGSSLSFTERMRVINSGGNGLDLYGRITLRNGTNPLDINYGSGIWMYKADNSALLGFMGVHNNQNLGFYGGPAGWGFTYDAINSRVGIGNQNPNAPLAFPAITGRKITLFPGATGNVGLGVHNNEFRIHSDYEPADITFGHENLAGVFTERFRFKGNGGFVINGNAGSPGQVLVSNGTNVSPGWVNNPVSDMYNNTEEIAATADVLIAAGQTADIPGLVKNLSLTKTSKVIVQFMVMINTPSCAFCGNSSLDIMILLNGGSTGRIRSQYENNTYGTATGIRTFTLTPGNYEIKLSGNNLVGPDIRAALTPPTVYPSFLNIQVIPQN